MTESTWSTPLLIDAGAYSVVGKVRDHNEDAARVDQELGLYVVADGLGGHLAGEHASNLAVEVLAHTLRTAREAGKAPSLDLLLQGFSKANTSILGDAEKRPEREGMGTTLTAIQVIGRRLLLAHVGDSRAWRLRDAKVQQLTQDHTVVAQQVREGLLSEEEAGEHPMRHILSRCLGVRDDIDVDLVEADVSADDVYVLASDGMFPGMPPADMRLLLQQNRDARIAARMLVNRACDRDGQDNITAVVVACSEA